MTFVITDGCIKCKYTDCVDVCPVPTCFHEGDNMLVIDPAVCIDCGLCEPECPVEAILPESYPEAEKWLGLNIEYSDTWPAILRSKPAPVDADDFRGLDNKFEQHFSPRPGEG
jgi:ferredoxin